MNYNVMVYVVDSSEKHIWTYIGHNWRGTSIPQDIWEDFWPTQVVGKRGIYDESLIFNLH